MGAFKDQIAPTAGRGPWSPSLRSGGSAWVDASPSHRCSVCGGDSWCQTHREGHTVLCKRVGNGGREKTNRDGVAYYVHRLAGAVREVMEHLPPTAERAPVAELDAAYQTILRNLRLDLSDRAGLRTRGLDDAAIDAGGYRTLPVEGRARLARAVLEEVGEDARAVPGIVWKTDDTGRGWWSLGGSPGLLIPVRDLEGQVVALKVHADS